MSNVIADTNFLLGLLDSKDKWHQRSIELYQSLKIAYTKMIVFDCVANELISVIGKRFEESGRQEKFKGFAQKKLMPLISKDNIPDDGRNPLSHFFLLTTREIFSG